MSSYFRASIERSPATIPTAKFLASYITLLGLFNVSCAFFLSLATSSPNPNIYAAIIMSPATSLSNIFPPLELSS
jgi:hypothetical protein